ncbi:uncharacterized protein LOC131290618 [Anopheles ziemanni]|uniref:uncharacterized protein LOC131268891 n=1 Tax=Anopheles coustani TaxID=139045 RepID=UPI00265A62E0|nr:uncharacterized protein LOC131268891 [Anopheles coustani]XP_058175764.1 uncharacterized protein LOC131290618 [Anopheles ziemanni]
MMQHGGIQDDNMKSDNPVPAPRPRQQITPLTPSVVEASTESPYEPVSFPKYVDKNVTPTSAQSASGGSNRPIPAPRLRSRVLLVDTDRPLTNAEPYQNVVIVRPAPTATPEKQLAKTNRHVPGSPTSTAAKDAPAVPPLPGKVNNNLHTDSADTIVTGEEMDTIEADSFDNAGKDGGEPGACRGENKYKTSSPADLFKTIGTTTRLLTEAIGERVAHKTKKAAQNVRTTGSSLVSWGTKSRGSPKGAGSTTEASPELKRPQTLPSPDLMQNIKFGSPVPLNNAPSPGSVGSGLDAIGDGSQLTYDTPRRGNKLSNLRLVPDTPSTAPSTASSSARASSSSMASSGVGTIGRFQRNAPASQSLYGRVLPKHARRLGSPGVSSANQPSGSGALVRSSKNKSESNLYESTFYVERPVPASDSVTHLYGKLNIIARPSISSTSSSNSSTQDLADGAGSDEDNNLPELLRAGVQLRERHDSHDRESQSHPSSTRATYHSSPKVHPSRLPATYGADEVQNRSNSWNFYDIAGAKPTDGEQPIPVHDEDEDEDGLSYQSSPEPVYANERHEATSSIYDQLSQMESLCVLKPLPAAMGALRHDYDEVSITDIIDEFDPLGRGTVTLEAIIENNAFGDGSKNAGASGAGGNLALIESLLGAESYSRQRIPIRPARQTTMVTDAGDTPRAIPKPPKRSDSLLNSTTTPNPTNARVRSAPAKPKRKKSQPDRPSGSIIVHQNLNLPGSVENLVEVDERVIEPHLATFDDGPPAGTVEAADNLIRPMPPQTSWYLEEDGGVADGGACAGSSGEAVSTRFDKQLNVNPVNEQASVSGRSEKAAKTSLPPELARPCATSVDTTEDVPVPPTYFEAIGGTDPLFERGLAATLAPAKSTSVATKLLNALKRKPSLNRGSSEPSGSAGVRTALEMVPKPRLTERLISHQGHVLKFPSGKIGDVLNELSPRSVVLRERIFQTYLDPQQTLPKEAIQLRFIMSLQCILQHKFAGDGRLDLHCFEIVLGVPKGGGGGDGGGGGSGGAAGASGALMSSTNPDLLITSGTSGNVKLTRQSYMFGTHKRSDRNLWMAKVLQSVTDVFGGEGDLLREFLRAGWCYVKKSVSAGWAGAWLLLAKRRLYLYSFAEGRLEELDLRKARCIGMIENEPATIGNLHVEIGPSLFIDCPPYATLYFIMGSPRETQIWHKVIRQAAHKNGLTLHSQQLTRGDVPVLIDKCVNFIYAHGSMSEGIYRKSGSLSAVSRVLQLFGEDAFDVQLTRNEYNEYEIAGALKKFVRELPGSFFGSYAASFVAIGSLSCGDLQLKVDSYRQLLERLPRIEYCTLKKLIGHLAFIASLEKHNRMGVPNLAMIWGSTLLANASQNTVQEPGSYHQQDADVVADLIRLYRRLFPVNEDELRKDQLMLAVLQKYHAAAENLSDAVKHSGDLKVWITIDCDIPPEHDVQAVVNSGAPEEKPQVNVDITPVKTASDVCKELANKTKYPWYKLTLYEVIANGALIRPIHYSEKVLEIVVRWTYWDEVDRKNNYLTLKPTTTLNDVYRTIQKAPVLTPTMELKFADRKTKPLRSFQLQLIGRGLVVLKKIEKKDKGFEELLKIDLSRMTAYIGCEPKRDRSSLRWAITLVDNDFKKRTRDSPYIGHIFGGLDFASQILWYSSILYSHYKDDILPSGDLFF